VNSYTLAPPLTGSAPASGTGGLRRPPAPSAILPAYLLALGLFLRWRLCSSMTERASTTPSRVPPSRAVKKGVPGRRRLPTATREDGEEAVERAIA